MEAKCAPEGAPHYFNAYLKLMVEGLLVYGADWLALCSTGNHKIPVYRGRYNSGRSGSTSSKVPMKVRSSERVWVQPGTVTNRKILCCIQGSSADAFAWCKPGELSP